MRALFSQVITNELNARLILRRRSNTRNFFCPTCRRHYMGLATRTRSPSVQHVPCDECAK